MATLVLNQGFDGIWPPDSMAGGTITLRQATKMVYTSDAGFTITLRGTDLTYDDDNMAAAGTVTGYQIVKNGVTYATLSGASAHFARTGMWLLGYEDRGNHRDPDTYSFIQHALRGDDLITGSGSFDDMRGGMGNDTINGGAGDDYFGDEQGNDVMNGGTGWDTLSYDEANFREDSFQGIKLDAVTGTVTDAWGFTDRISNFEQYKDTAYGDTLKGSAIDNEEWVLTRGDDALDGRGGSDWVSYTDVGHWGARRGVNVNLATGTAVDSWKGTDSLSNIENIKGSDFNDTLTGNAQDNFIMGGGGVDVMAGGGGYDYLAFWNVGNNNDGGHGVTLNLNLGKSVVDDGYGNTETATGFEAFNGTRMNDKLTGDGAKNEFHGDDGADTLIGGGEEDDLSGDWGNDVIDGGTGDNDHLNGGGGNDTMTGGGGSDNFNFNWNLADSGVDTLTDFNVPYRVDPHPRLLGRVFLRKSGRQPVPLGRRHHHGQRCVTAPDLQHQQWRSVFRRRWPGRRGSGQVCHPRQQSSPDLRGFSHHVLTCSGSASACPAAIHVDGF